MKRVGYGNCQGSMVVMFRSIDDIWLKNQDHQERGCECQEKSLPNCASLLEDCALIAHFKLYGDKRHIFHVTSKLIFIRVTSGILITIRGTRYPFLFLFHIEDNVYFKGGRVIALFV